MIRMSIFKREKLTTINNYWRAYVHSVYNIETGTSICD